MMIFVATPNACSVTERKKRLLISSSDTDTNNQLINQSQIF